MHDLTQAVLDFERTHSHRNDPATSRDAARRQLPRLTETLERVYEYFLAHPEGRTDFEGARDLAMYSFSRRRCDLYAKGHGVLEPTGETRPGPTGSHWTVWRIKA
ncbi:MAG: hypothetical protein JSV86_12895 [Gemmatimonadota bacterium]|nr:MAG: hypothetical protein JSV86_12895 [Gemmatimonadota bacterium]